MCKLYVFTDWSDIGYSFVVGEDGNVYEARGWDAVGAHTLHHNYDGLGKCVSLIKLIGIFHIFSTRQYIHLPMNKKVTTEQPPWYSLRLVDAVA